MSQPEINLKMFADEAPVSQVYDQLKINVPYAHMCVVCSRVCVWIQQTVIELQLFKQCFRVCDDFEHIIRQTTAAKQTEKKL